MSVKQAQCRFLVSATDVRQFPATNLLEVAFVGKSNVGKSSLINALVGSEACRVSKTPGRTQQINFFDTRLATNHLIIADLPGYGYAVVPKQMRDNWNLLITNYLQTRNNLKRIFLLIDSRHGVKKNDEEVMSFLDKICVQYQLVLTKIDKIKSKQEKADYERVLLDTQEIIGHHSAAFPTFLKTSSQNTAGLTDIFKAIMSISLKG